MDSIAPGGVVTLYRKSGLEIKVLYFNGTAGEVRFEKSEKDALGFAEEFSQTEIESLMEANGGGKEWQDGGPSSGGGKMWALIDQSAYAIYSKPENSLQFTTAEFYKKLAANIKIEEKKNLDKARKRLEYAEQKEAAVRRWKPVVEQQFRETCVRLVHFREVIDVNCPKAMAALERMLKALDAYRATQGPAAGGSGGSGGSGATMARPTDEAPATGPTAEPAGPAIGPTQPATPGEERA